MSNKWVRKVSAVTMAFVVALCVINLSTTSANAATAQGCAAACLSVTANGIDVSSTTISSNSTLCNTKIATWWLWTANGQINWSKGGTTYNGCVKPSQLATGWKMKFIDGTYTTTATGGFDTALACYGSAKVRLPL